VFDQHSQASQRDRAAVEVEQVEAVETQQVSLYFAAMRVE